MRDLAARRNDEVPRNLPFGEGLRSGYSSPVCVTGLNRQLGRYDPPRSIEARDATDLPGTSREHLAQRG
jgi:hypothetical protein